jgi:hypothetical protein
MELSTWRGLNPDRRDKAPRGCAKTLLLNAPNEWLKAITSSQIAGHIASISIHHSSTPCNPYGVQRGRSTR